MPDHVAPGGAIRFTADPADVDTAAVTVVLDTTWTAPGGAATSSPIPTTSPRAGRVVGLRDVAERVLSTLDLIVETSARLDRWAATSGVVDRLMIRDTSFWFYVRLRHWLWLEERVAWAAIVAELVREHDPRRIVCAPGIDAALLDVLRLVAARDGRELVDETPPEPEPEPEPVIAEPPPPPVAVAPGSRLTSGLRSSMPARLARRVRRWFIGPPPPSPWALRRQEIADRMARVRSLVDTIAAEPAERLLVVHEHALQRVETATGPRTMNPYLDPIVDRLRGTRLEPVVLDIRAQAGHDAAWERIGSGLDPNRLPADALAIRVEAAVEGVAAGEGASSVRPVPGLPPVPAPSPAPDLPPVPGASVDAIAGMPTDGVARVPADAAPPAPANDTTAAPANGAQTVPDGPAIDPALAAWRDALDSPMDAFGVDLGPLLAAEVARVASGWLPGMTSSVDRIERFIRRIHPAGILLADEYHRQDWMAAARAAGVPVAAVQHGMIYPHHNGYIHAARPDSLRLPGRTFVFGRWERDLLRTASVYRDDEVVVGGSPRLDLVVADPAARGRIRSELGIADDERIVLVSGTWGGIYRRFHYPIALAALIDRPLPDVHFVVKLHPGEPDEGPYRRIIEGAAAARGFATPRITTVRSIDLYRLLAAADAHLGIHSTVLTEAIVTRTPNLLADALAGADLLGYVEAGVAIPVRNGADLLAALDPAGAGGLGEANAAAFVEAHFEPGSASERIAASLEAWLR